MKINRQGQAKVLTEQELHDLFTIGLLTPRDRLLFGICLYTGCRVGEASSLAWADVTTDAMTFRIEKTIDWELGNRDSQTLSRLLERLAK